MYTTEKILLELFLQNSFDIRVSEMPFLFFFFIFSKQNNMKENAVVSCLFYQSLRAISKVQFLQEKR